ncbi:Rpb7-binding protein seb1 [Lachnellula cervina]|uniref:Rpb7-binding protein seb1 n=1 Tax=Lachnellula cervina TaxID=1316786 RepID=A0A7D8YRY5_9HELO|nr:Rpb7-binding protein seb1 [Lachnellula cervina]
MSSPVAELETGLQAMLLLKPPGVSGSRIQALTTLCTANVQSESVLVQKLYTHFMRAPASHKLGVLYVVDSVTRKWTEQAKNAGQTINVSAEDGTFAAGVNRVKELLPNLMNNIIASSPDKDQKDRIRKLLDIWEKAQTFPLSMLNDFKEKLTASMQNESTTPPGSPPADLQRAFGSTMHPGAPATPAAPATATSAPSILQALASLARQNASTSADNSYSVSNTHHNGAPAANQTVPFPHVPQPVNVPAASFASQPPYQGASNGAYAQSFASNQTNPNTFAAAPPVVQPGGLDPALQQQILLVKALADQGLTTEQIQAVLAVGAGGLPQAPQPFAAQQQSQNQNQNVQSGWNGAAASRPDDSRDYNGYHDREAVRSPPNRYRQRSRSRSPPRAWNSPASRRRDESNTYDFDRNSPARNRGDERGRGGAGRGGAARGNDYRQRSPARRGRSPSPPRSRGAGQKWIDHDSSIPKGSIKVLSRTLFVGGVTTSDQELRNVFENYGRVQTCIVNKEKRHAFVKMISRADAVRAKEAMEKNRAPDSQLRTRWGVGFGPRDCSDYQTGVSVIPISKLTDADRKWMLSAEYGGSGGMPIESGMVVEEPDIEIGQGVSSKAISRRMQTDKGGNNGPKSSRDREEEENAPRFRRDNRDHRRDDDHRGNRRDRDQAVSAPPSMPAVPPFSMAGLPFPFPTQANGLPMFPPGFVFPGQATAQPQQPPPPGHRT